MFMEYKVGFIFIVCGTVQIYDTVQNYNYLYSILMIFFRIFRVDTI